MVIKIVPVLVFFTLVVNLIRNLIFHPERDFKFCKAVITNDIVPTGTQGGLYLRIALEAKRSRNVLIPAVRQASAASDQRFTSYPLCVRK